MAKYRVISGQVLDGDRRMHGVGDEVELTERGAKTLLGLGVVEPIKVAPVAPPKPKVDDKGN